MLQAIGSLTHAQRVALEMWCGAFWALDPNDAEAEARHMALVVAARAAE